MYFQICLPVVGFNANTPPLLPVIYITPSTTTGVASVDTCSVVPPVKLHASFSWETLEGLIWSMLWNRELLTSTPLYAQSTSWANSGSMLNAQQSNAVATFDIELER